MQAVGGSLAWEPIVKSRARLGGEFGEEEEEVSFACYYHSMCQAIYNGL